MMAIVQVATFTNKAFDDALRGVGVFRFNLRFVASGVGPLTNVQIVQLRIDAPKTRSHA
jgi:pyruvoyl-dependent arginine decarboxylase (PvlArgDC)